MGSRDEKNDLTIIKVFMACGNLEEYRSLGLGDEHACLAAENMLGTDGLGEAFNADILPTTKRRSG